MGMPAYITQNGTGTSAIWFADWMQTPFSLSIGAIATGGPGYNIEYTLDNIDIITNTLNGANSATTAANATWFQSSITGQTISTTGVASAPVRALRINVMTSTATAFVTAVFIQATFGR